MAIIFGPRDGTSATTAGGRRYGGVSLGTELRRVVHAVRWQRQDPVIQLPPGSTLEVTHSVTTGLTVERSQMLAKSLGLSTGTNAAGVQARLSSQLNREFRLQLDIRAQEEKTRKLTVTNESAAHYRRFALWHVSHRITVDALDVPIHEECSTPCFATWVRRGDVEFVLGAHPFLTYTEVPRS